MSGRLFKKDKNPATPIEQKDALIVREEIIHKLVSVYPDLEYLYIGSIGKKLEPSGDIDIAIKCNDIDELYGMISTTFSKCSIVEHKSIYIVSMKYCYNINKYVAVDFMMVRDLNYTAFRYYCPNYINGESKYKVGTKIMFVGLILNHCISGEIRNIADTIPQYEFLPTELDLCLYEKTTGQYAELFVTRDPQKVVDIMFNNATTDICNSVETLWDGIHSDKFKYPEEVKAIELALFVNSYRKGWEEFIKPENFKLQYWTKEEIYEKLKVHKKLREINETIFKLYTT